LLNICLQKLAGHNNSDDPRTFILLAQTSAAALRHAC
jgi:hypothetical protein